MIQLFAFVVMCDLVIACLLIAALSVSLLAAKLEGDYQKAVA